MYSINNRVKRFTAISILASIFAIMLSACSPNKTQVGTWWVDQQWESASVSGETDR